MTMLRIFPDLVLASRKDSSAIRGFFLVRSLMRQGHGPIVKVWRVEELFDRLNITERRRRNWITSAINKGYLRLDKYKDGQQFFVVTGIAQVANLLSKEIGEKITPGNAADVDIDGFCAVSGWKSYVWAAFNARLNPELPISQVRRRVLSGVPERTQRRWEHQDKDGCNPTQKIKNWVDTGMPPEHLEAVQEFCDKPHAVVRNGTVQWQISNNYVVDPDIAVSHRSKYPQNNLGKTGNLAGSSPSTEVAIRYWTHRDPAPNGDGLTYLVHIEFNMSTKSNTWKIKQ